MSTGVAPLPAMGYSYIPWFLAAGQSGLLMHSPPNQSGRFKKQPIKTI
jgi:hypothetical protein